MTTLAKRGDLQLEVKRLSSLLEEKNQEKTELVRMRSRHELSPEEFERARSECTLEISDIEENILRLKEFKSASEAFDLALRMRIS